MGERIVAFQGEHGAYSEEAIHRQFGEDTTTLPCETFAEVFEAIQRGRATHGMVPVENALAGTVFQVYELLIEHDFRVQAEHLLPITHHLLAPEGTALEDIKRVMSHPQALAQCTDTLHRRGWEPVATYDTAGAARALAAPAPPDSRWRLFANTYVVTALNPKGMIFFVAFLPQFINPHADVPGQLWLLSATFVALATINATLYAVFAATARRLLTSPRAQRRFNLTGGTLLCAAGVWALLARRAA